MQLNIKIEDKQLEALISDYVTNKNKQVNELIVEALNFFLKSEKNRLYYETQNPDASSTTIDFNLTSDKKYKLFEDVDDVKKYSKELRNNAWK